MKIDLILVGQRNQVIDLFESFGIVVAGPRLYPGPQNIKADDVESEFVHLGEISFDVFGIPLHRPLHSSLSGNPVRAYRKEAMAIAGEIIPIEAHAR